MDLLKYLLDGLKEPKGFKSNEGVKPFIILLSFFPFTINSKETLESDYLEIRFFFCNSTSVFEVSGAPLTIHKTLGEQESSEQAVLITASGLQG